MKVSLVSVVSDGARLGGVVNDFIIVGGIEGLVGREAHERVAVGGDEIDSGAELFAREAVELRSQLSAAAEDAFDAVVGEVDFLGERFEQLGRGEGALDVGMAAEDRQGLIDAVVFIEVGFLHFAALDALDDPARVEIDAEGDAAAMLGEVLDRKAQAARAGRAEHEPVGAFGE